MSRKGGNEVCDGGVELVRVGVDVAVGGAVARDHMQTTMVVLEGGSEQALGDGSSRDQDAGDKWVKLKGKGDAFRSLVVAAAAPRDDLS